MYWVLRMLLLITAPGLALAQDMRPAETPPPDFFGRQYIDSRGCVFLRDDGDDWQPRVSRDGTAVCGYPPTLSARGLDGKPRLRALDPNAGRSRAQLLEAALSQTIITNALPGELTSDARALETLPDMGPEPSPTGPAQALRAAVAAAPAVRQDMGGGLRPNLRLCELLGYDGKPAGAQAKTDPSQGYCKSLPASDLSMLSFTRPIGSSAEAPSPQPTVTPPRLAKAGAVGTAEKPAAEKATAGTPTADKPTAAKTPADKAIAGKTPASKTIADQSAKKPAQTPAVGQPQPAAAKPSAGKTAVAAQSTGKAPAATGKPATARPAGPAMIPAGARYVQLGSFRQAQNADRAAQRLTALGYQALRGRDRVDGREVQFIMAGPFDDRESIVRALDAIRRAGYSDAFPR